MRDFIRNSRKFVHSWFEHKKHATDRTDPGDLKKEESSLLYLYSKVFLLLFRTRLESAMRIAPYFPDLGSIVIRFVFSDYETVAGRKVSVKSLARTRNRCYIFCIYFRRHFDKTSRCVPIKFAWTVDLSTKREREKENSFVIVVSREDSLCFVPFPRTEPNRTFVSDRLLVSRHRCCGDC